MPLIVTPNGRYRVDKHGLAHLTGRGDLFQLAAPVISTLRLKRRYIVTLTLKQAVTARGIDEKRASAHWRRRSRHPSGDRPKIWSTSCRPPDWMYGRETSGLFEALNSDDIQAYVSAWSVLNHLKGECS